MRVKIPHILLIHYENSGQSTKNLLPVKKSCKVPFLIIKTYYKPKNTYKKDSFFLDFLTHLKT